MGWGDLLVTAVSLSASAAACYGAVRYALRRAARGDVPEADEGALREARSLRRRSATLAGRIASAGEGWADAYDRGEAGGDG